MEGETTVGFVAADATVPKSGRWGRPTRPAQRVAAYRAEAEAGHEAAVEEAVGEEGDGRRGVDDGEHVVELEGPLPRPVVRLVHVPQGGVPQRPVRPPRPELHPDLHPIQPARTAKSAEFQLEIFK